MYKATAKDVRDLQQWGKNNEYVSELMSTGAQPPIHETAYQAPSGANWSWRIGIINHNGKTYELLTQFGEVKGGRQIYLVNY